MPFLSAPVPKCVLDDLKCTYCSLYLSVPPIMYNEEQNLVCGRCTDKISNDSPKFPAKAFETLATFLLFPCRYTQQGCPEEELSWKSVEIHEIGCEHQIRNCPVTTTDCSWKGKSEMLLDHFKQTHNHRILQDMDGFSLSLQNSVSDVAVMSAHDSIFLIYFESNTGEEKFRFGIFCGSSKIAHECCYTLALKNPDDSNTITFQNDVLPNYEWTFRKDNALQIQFSSLRDVLNTSRVLCKIRITRIGDQAGPSVGTDTEPPEKAITSTEVNEFLLRDLECPVCMEYIIPPIFVCQSGHSICGDCKGKLDKCSTCRAPFKNARNFLLEKLTSHINYPCRGRASGCNFVGNSSSLSEHLTVCFFKDINCPLKGLELCRWKGAPTKCAEHLLNSHKSEILRPNSKHLNHDLRSPITFRFRIFCFNEQAFKIYSKHSLKAGGSISWDFQHIGLQPYEVSPYRFELEFVDQTNSDRKLIVDAVCRGMTSDNDNFNSNTLTIPYGMLTPFVTSEKLLIFKYNIRKC